MLRISNLTDYALILLTEMKENEVISATSLSQKTHIPLATTNKILKLLLKNNICKSKSGKTGGFYLSKSLNNISFLDVVQSIDNVNLHLTQCSEIHNNCELKIHCKISKKMNAIDKEIYTLLQKKFISDLLF